MNIKKLFTILFASLALGAATLLGGGLIQNASAIDGNFTFSVSGATVLPSVDPNTFDYYVDLPSEEFTTTVSYSASSGSTVAGAINTQSLKANETYRITVTDAGGEINIYELHAYYNKSYLKSANIDGFSPEITEYNLDVDTSFDKFEFEALENNYQIDGDVNLSFGRNNIKITATAPGREATEYNFSIYRDGVTRFSYTGAPQEFIIPTSGTYKVELWGASGNDAYGYGAYTSGLISLAKDTKLYLYVGKQGLNESINQAFGVRNFNGGGHGSYTCYDISGGSYSMNYMGGSATDIRLVGGNWDSFDSLKSRLMVAAAGTVTRTEDNLIGTPGGGLIGYNGTYSTATGGTQTNAGGDGGFGYGGSPEWGGQFCQASIMMGGSSGYYGGGARTGSPGEYRQSNAGSGSSFISGHAGSDAIAESSTESNIIHTGQENHYSGFIFTDTLMVDGTGYRWTNVKTDEQVGMPGYDGVSHMTGNLGDGYAKITYLSPDAELIEFKVTTDEQDYIVRANSVDREYVVEVPNYIERANISITPSSRTSTMTGDQGEISLSFGENIRTYVVTSEDGTNIETYTLKIVRPKSSNAKLSDVKINNVSVADFDKDTLEYTLDPVKSNVEYIYFSDIIKEDTYATTEIIGNNLVTGDNTVIIRVTAQDEITLREYKFHVYKQSGDADLASLSVNGVNLSDFNPNKLEYDYTYDDGIGNFAIAGTASDTKATVAGNGTYIEYVHNRAVITVTAEDGTEKEYKINFVRRLFSGAGLKSLSVSVEGEEYDLVPTFEEDIDIYTILVPSDAESAIISATTAKYIKSISGTGLIGLGGRTNRHEITVVAEDESETKTYTLNIVKKLSDVADINELSLLDSTGSVLTISDDDFGENLTYDLGAFGGSLTAITFRGFKLRGAESKLDVIGNENLVPGDNIVILRVTAQDGSTKDYKLKVYKKNNDATLATLSASNCTLSPSFASDRFEYTCEYADGATELELFATATDEKATIVGARSYDVSENSASILVTAEDGTTNIYRINFEKKLSADSTLSDLGVYEPGTNNSYALSPALIADNKNFSVTVESDVEKVEIRATVASSNAQVTEGLGEKTLSYGTNSFNIIVQAEDGTSSVYVVNINRKVNTAASLSDIKIDGETLDGFETNVTTYYKTVPYAQDKISLTATGAENATVTGEGEKDLAVGDNSFTLEVRSQDGMNLQRYIINVRRQSNAAKLLNLSATYGSLSPNFDANTLEYTLTIPADVDTSTLIATPAEGATVLNPTDLINFAATTSTVNILVQAEDANYTDTYKINITRLQSTNNFLSSLSVDDYTLTPSFDKYISEYTLELPAGVDSVNIQAAAEHSKATVSGTGTHSLSVGVNELKVSVRAEDGSLREYSIAVILADDGDEQILSDIYSINSNNILNVLPDTSVSVFKNNLKNDNEKLVLYEAGGIREYNGDTVATGMVVKLVVRGRVRDQKTLVVKGDVDGDGTVDLFDSNKIVKHYLEMELLSGVYLLAADIDGDGEIDLLDANRAVRHYVEIEKIN